jgi:hypothetical protein
MEHTRDRLLVFYNTCCHALHSLIKLGSSELEAQFPHLTVQDLYRKSVHDKRQLGDTHRADGRLWVSGGLGLSSQTSHSSLITHPGSTGTENNVLNSSETGGVEPNSGKLWNPVIGLTDTELEN